MSDQPCARRVSSKKAGDNDNEHRQRQFPNEMVEEPLHFLSLYHPRMKKPSPRGRLVPGPSDHSITTSYRPSIVKAHRGQQRAQVRKGVRNKKGPAETHVIDNARDTGSI